MDPESPTNFTTDGKVLIHFNTSEEINASLKSIAVHSKQIVIKESQVLVVEVNTKAILDVIGHEYDKGQEIWKEKCGVFNSQKTLISALASKKWLNKKYRHFIVLIRCYLNVIKCLYFFDLTSNYMLGKKLEKKYWFFGRIEDTKICFWNFLTFKDREFYVIHLGQDLKPNTDYRVTIPFIAILNDDLSGFYRRWVFKTEYICKSYNPKFLNHIENIVPSITFTLF